MKFLPLLVLALATLGGQATPIPLVEYGFNETGLTAPSSGSAAGAGLSFFNAAGTAADLHGAAGGGVGGDLVGHAQFGLDRAFDNTASTAMGNAGVGGLANTSADVNAIDALTSFTLSGWFKTEGATGITGFARLFVNESGNVGMHLLGGDVAGELRPKVDNVELGTPDVQGYGDTQKWVFFAFTYDGTLTANNALFYKGYRNASESGVNPFQVSLIETRTMNVGAVAQDTSVLMIGNRTGTRDRPFDGFLDNMRIHGSASDASGALSLVDLEDLRAGDVLVPEPGSASLFALGLVGWLLRRR